MDERSNLIDQIKGLQDDLRQARNTLVSVLDKKLITLEHHKDISSRVENLLDPLEKKLADRLKKVDLTLDNDLRTIWESLEKDRKKCDEIFQEFLSFLGGALIRQNQLDNGVCAIADNLLADLSSRSDIPWTRMTILGEGDFFAEMTEIIRLRFPELTIWNLPIVGHEFGHFVGRELRKRIKDRKQQRDIFQEILQKEKREYSNLSQEEREKEEAYLYENLADIFATYSLGPAFAFTTILLKFNPNQNQDRESHPSDIKRVYIILKTLEEIQENSEYRNIIERLQEGWTNTFDTLNNRITDFHKTLNDEISRARFTKDDFLRSNVLSEEICQDRTLEELQNLSCQGYTLRQIINAAWIGRLHHSNQSNIVNIINKNSLILCHLINHYQFPIIQI
jgi:hypothetical protein